MNDLYFHITVKPKSTQNKVVRAADGLQVQVTAAPNDGEANKAVLALLAKTLHMPKKDLEITAGKSGRLKKISVRGINAEELSKRLQSL